MKLKYFTFVGDEDTNVACALCVESSTASSDALNHYSTEATPKKDAQVAYITSPDAAVHSVKGFYMSQCMRFSTMWYVRPAKPQISLRIRAV